MALQVELEDVRSASLKLSKALKDARNGTGCKKGNGDSESKKKDVGKKMKNPKDFSNKRNQKKHEAWKKVPPKQGEHKSKQVGKKTWN